MSDNPLERLTGDSDPRDSQGRQFVITPKGVIYLYLTELGLDFEKALEVADKIERDIMSAGYVYSYVPSPTISDWPEEL